MVQLIKTDFKRMEFKKCMLVPKDQDQLSDQHKI